MEMKFKMKVTTVLLSLTLFGSMSVYASPVIKLFPSKHNHLVVPTNKLLTDLKNKLDVNTYKKIAFQVIYDEKTREPDHVLVYLFSKKFHSFKIARMDVDKQFNLKQFSENYRLSSDDLAQQPGITASQATCPDQSIEFIAFAPNDDDFEQQITVGVAKVAKEHSLKTIELLKETATRSNYLNYMKCSKLKGNFYDGDANPEVITTVDGVVTYSDIKSELNNQFQYKVTNIWLACEAYNDPMKSTMLFTAQSQKYAAGINDLEVGPSDEAAACAMKDAISGKPMTAAFQACYNQYDTKADQWGFGGDGSDVFGA